MSNMNVSAAAYNPYASVQSTTQTSNYNPYTTGPVVSDGGGSGSGIGGFSTDFSSISSMVSHAGGGGFAGYKLGGKMGESIKGLFGKAPTPPADGGGAGQAGFGKNFMTGVKGIAITGLKGAGLSALVSAGISAVGNGVGVATGKVESSAAVSNVIKDTIGGAVGGLTGVTAAGFASMIPVGGAFGTILTVGAGAIGGVLGGRMASKLTEGF